MSHKFAEIAFTAGVKAVQQEMGSREGYRGMEGGEDYNHLFSPVEAEFITERDSFYIASVSETGWPYVQHRGGPPGFVKVLDANTIGFADYAGNRQYVSTGNFRSDGRVSLFFMDYPNRRRLKLLGRVREVDQGNLETMAMLEDDHFGAPVERAFLIRIEAFDWNCPKYITPRYTDDQVEALIAPLQARIDALSTVADDEATPPSPAPSPDGIIGNGPLPLVIRSVRQETDRIRSYELVSANDQPLPPVEAGAHIQVPVPMQDGTIAWRSYSISSDPGQQKHYRIAVLEDPDGLGGSRALHAGYQVGMTLACYRPGNYFSLQKERHEAGGKAVLIAAGIGITPIISMAMAAAASGFDFHLHYLARSRKDAAFLDEVEGLGDQASVWASADGNRADISSLLADASADTRFYVCGPEGLLDAVSEQAIISGLAKDQVVTESFNG